MTAIAELARRNMQTLRQELCDIEARTHTKCRLDELRRNCRDVLDDPDDYYPELESPMPFGLAYWIYKE